MTIPTARPEIPAAAYRDRLERLTALTAERGFEAVLVGVGPDLEYLTGYRAMPLERLTLLVVARDAQPFLVVPRLERAAAQAGTRVERADPDLGGDRGPVRGGVVGPRAVARSRGPLRGVGPVVGEPPARVPGTPGRG